MAAPPSVPLQNIPIDHESGFHWRKMLTNYLDSNPYFSAGFGLMSLGVAATVVRRGLVQATHLARRQMLVNLEITSKDPSYLWFLQWMEAEKKSPKALTSLSGRLAGRIKSHDLAVETSTETLPSGTQSVSFNLVPGPGRHYFLYQNAWFQVSRERDAKMMDFNMGTPFETIKITTLSRDRHLFPELLEEAREIGKSAKVGRTVIYTAWGTEWRPFGQPRARRLLESVVLDRGVKERIVEDVKGFMGRGQWYAERGIPFRRGYLLHGPPGSGKTSFIQALAGSLGLDIAILNLSERGLTDDKLNHLLANAPEDTIILLEDIDAAFSGRTKKTDDGFVISVTFSGLLNALDGVAASTSKRILFMTTNHVEKLDPALIRPGRVDLKELISDATSYQAGELFQRFFAGAVPDAKLADHRARIEKLVAAETAAGRSISMAALQGLFIQCQADQILDRITQLYDQEQRRVTQHKAAIPSLPS